MTINKKPSIISRDYESDFDHLKRIYADNRTVEQCVIDFSDQSLSSHEITILAYDTNTTGDEHAK